MNTIENMGDAIAPNLPTAEEAEAEEAGTGRSDTLTPKLSQRSPTISARSRAKTPSVRGSREQASVGSSRER
jgi:hypothetical protein